MSVQALDYFCDGVTLKGKLASAVGGQGPGVLVAHDWTGCNESAVATAEKLSQEGYTALAIDMYGDGRQGTDNDEKMALMEPLKNDRELLRKRIIAAYEALKSHNTVKSDRLGIVGFCFGGLCALDLARSGMPVAAVVSFHGLLDAPGIPCKQISGRVLVLHGYEDPMVPPEQMLEFANEMTRLKADWQIHVYGHTVHAFTNPLANDPILGTVYDAKISDRAWESASALLSDALIK